MAARPETIGERLEARLQEARSSHYVLTLFVTGASDLSARAITNIRAICEEHLAGRYTLQVIDVHKDVQLMSSYDLVAAPALVKESPMPKRMLVGDLSDTRRVLAALDVVDVASLTSPAPEE